MVSLSLHTSVHEQSYFIKLSPCATTRKVERETERKKERENMKKREKRKKKGRRGRTERENRKERKGEEKGKVDRVN